MTDKPRVPADDARGEGRVIAAPVTHQARVLAVGSSWFPCEFPERPFDSGACWHMRCEGCRVLAEARCRREPACPSALTLLNLLDDPPPNRMFAKLEVDA